MILTGQNHLLDEESLLWQNFVWAGNKLASWGVSMSRPVSGRRFEQNHVICAIAPGLV